MTYDNASQATVQNADAQAPAEALDALDVWLLNELCGDAYLSSRVTERVQSRTYVSLSRLRILEVVHLERE